MYKVEMPYIGSMLSDNHYKISGTTSTNLTTKLWMRELENKIAILNIPKELGYYIIEYCYFFESDNHPDIANLHKVSNDAVKRGLGIDDKYFLTRDLEIHLYQPESKIIISIRKAEGGVFKYF